MNIKITVSDILTLCDNHATDTKNKLGSIILSYKQFTYLCLWWLGRSFSLSGVDIHSE